MAVRRIYNDRHYFPDVSGNNAGAGYQLGFYLAGSTTPATTYNSNLGTTPNSNPMTLDAAGRLQAEVWATTGIPLKIAYGLPGASFPFSSPVWTEDNVTVLNDVSPANITGEWIASGFTPTYISANAFSVPGDQTAILNAPRRLQIVDAGGTKYATITGAGFSLGVTTVGVQVDAGGSLSNPISSIAYGIISASNSSAPPRIAFPATQITSADPNTLDDYEEGTWTPSIGGSATYTVQLGTYIKIGKAVIFNGQLTINVIGTGSTTSISGLPFVAATFEPVVVGSFSSIATSVTCLTGFITANTLDLYSLTAAGTALAANAIFKNGAIVRFNGCYQATN